MKKCGCFLIIILFVLSFFGCSVKRTPDTFSIPDESVHLVEIQKKYIRDDGSVYYMKKEITEGEDQIKICRMIRKLNVNASAEMRPKPIYDIPMVVILHGDQNDRFLILGEEWAVFDSFAYDYNDPRIPAKFMNLYDNLAYNETETELTKY